MHCQGISCTTGLLAAAAGVIAGVPSAAQASATRHAEPLRDLPPAATAFRDRVLTGAAHAAARAAAAGERYRTPDGAVVRVALSPAYAADPRVAQGYADFLDTLPHGSELGSLSVYVTTPADVVTRCGGVAGTLACYDARTRTMTVPGRNETSDPGVTTSFVVAHEYGHHVAASRENPPFDALALGPKYWSSYERVCARSLAGRLAPGDEAAGYLENPGEAWADTYARLTYPEQPWTFTPLLEPDAGALAAARRDVEHPWTRPVTRTFRGAFTAAGASRRAFSFDLHLDGALSLKLRGRRGLDADLVVLSGSTRQGATSAPGSRDSLRYSAACRTRATEHITVRVVRRHGSGPFTVTTTYDG